MRFLIAPDKFKGSLDAVGVAESIRAGIVEVLPEAQTEIAPMADGGEGTAEVVRAALGGEWVTCQAHDALGRKMLARYLWLGDRALGVIQISETAGLCRLRPEERDPSRTDTFGVGEMLLDAAQRGAREIVLALGGSATNDGGFGLARAVGFQFFGPKRAVSGAQLLNGPADLVSLERIKAPPSRFLGVSENAPKITGAADVRSPLLGTNGATRVFAAQKGATLEQILSLERALTTLAEVTRRDLGCDFRDYPGAGAAGGLGFGLLSFCHASLRSGFGLVAEMTGLEGKVQRADFVITGEGRLDPQTFAGKVPAGVADLARRNGKPVYAVVGERDPDSPTGLFDDVISLRRDTLSRAEAMKHASEFLRERGAELASRFT